MLMGYKILYSILSQVIFRNVNFSLLNGSIISLVGPNGSGKTSFLKVIATILKSYGSVLGFFNNFYLNSFISFKKYQYFTDFINVPNYNLTVNEDLKFWSSLSNTSKFKDGVLYQLDLYYLKDTQIIHLSSGQRRRCLLARQLLSNKVFWIMDEPTVALDSKSIDLLKNSLICHQIDGGFIMFSTHSNLKLDHYTFLRLT